jgi:hypothetical protein
MRNVLRLVLLGFLVLLGSMSARADSTLLLYSLTGPVDATFLLPINPVIAPGDADPDFGFTLTPIDLKIGGVASGDNLSFFSILNSAGGAFGAFSPDGLTQDFSLTGIQLYSGSEAQPTMLDPLMQPIPLSDIDTGATGYSLTITPFSNIPSTPEPSSLLLLVVSFMLMVAWMRNRS